MSKIYEALLRAELDRLAVDGEEEMLEEHKPDQGITPHRETVNFTASATSNVPSRESELMSALFLGKSSSFGSVRKLNWQPDISRLPAIEHRGKVVEQFRSLRSRLYELRSRRPLKSLLVSSALPQEGKSFVACNLALCLALHQNSKVLLIDGDMRRYTLHTLLGCDSKPGLASYLSGESSLLEVMQQSTAHGASKNSELQKLDSLTFIPGGEGSDKAAELSGSKRFGELITSMSEYFDWIIVDSSPVNLVSDAVNLARACDGVMLVAREGVTQAKEAQRAVNEFNSDNLLGFAINGSRENNKQDYYGYDSTYDRQD